MLCPWNVQELLKYGFPTEFNQVKLRIFYYFLLKKIKNS